MPAQATDDPGDIRVSTGNAGLDDILGGGFDPDRMYLYEGRPGAGKTTLALEFLLEGARRGERVLYITLSETERELRLVARRTVGTCRVEIVELVPRKPCSPEPGITLCTRPSWNWARPRG